MGASGDVQDVANKVVDAAQDLANEAVDLTEEAAKVALGAVIKANRLLGDVLEKLQSVLVGE